MVGVGVHREVHRHVARHGMRCAQCSERVSNGRAGSLVPSGGGRTVFYGPTHAGSRTAGTAHRTPCGMGELEEQPAEQLAEVRAERDELVDERASSAPATPTRTSPGG